MAKITLDINGSTYEVEAEPGRTLLSVLRNELDLTGSKYGCGEGQCGACTVLVDGEPRRSCVMPLRSAAGKRIVTIEGIAAEGELHPVQQAFLDKGALQCGYCTPGMIVAAVGLLHRNPHPSREEIIDHMQGNICRCGTYTRIVEAIELAAGNLQEEKP